MKVSKEKLAANRSAIVDAAERLFRERGFAGVGVAEIASAAGLTHGGFYGHFESKNALAAEACRSSFAKGLARARKQETVASFIAYYLADERRKATALACPMPAYATEIARQPEAVQASFVEGLQNILGYLDDVVDGENNSTKRSRAIAVAASLVGAMTLARATAAVAPDLSAEILERVCAELQGAFGATDGAVDRA